MRLCLHLLGCGVRVSVGCRDNAMLAAVRFIVNGFQRWQAYRGAKILGAKGPTDQTGIAASAFMLGRKK